MNSLPSLESEIVETFALTYVQAGARRTAIREAAEAIGLAGDKPKPPMAAYQFFNRPDVQKRIRELIAEIHGELHIDMHSTFQEIGSIAFADPGEMLDEEGRLLPLHRMSPRMRAAIASVDYETHFEGRGEDAVPVHTIKLRLHSKNEMLKLLAQHFKIIGSAESEVSLANELAAALRDGRLRAQKTRRPELPLVEEVATMPPLASPVQPVTVEQESRDEEQLW